MSTTNFSEFTLEELKEACTDREIAFRDTVSENTLRGKLTKWEQDASRAEAEKQRKHEEALVRAKEVEFAEAEKARAMEKDRQKYELERLTLLNANNPQLPEANNPRAPNYSNLLSKFAENETAIDVYLVHFEKAMQLHGVVKEKWPVALSSVVSGKALEVFSRMDEESLKDYEKIKKELLSKYQLSSESFRKKFRKISKKDSETYAEMAYRMQEAYNSWMKGCSAEGDAEKIGEQILMEQFFDVVPDSLRIWLTDRAPESLKIATGLADSYIESRACIKERNNSMKSTVNNGMPKVAARNAYNNKLSAQGSKGEDPGKGKATYSNPLVSASDRNVAGLICYYCKKEGHTKRFCPKKKEDDEKRASGGKPHTSNFAGHPLIKSSEMDATIKKQQVVALNDTGASICLIVPDLVHPLEYLDEDISIRQTFSEELFTLPLARVFVDTKDFSGYIEAAVHKSLPYQLILGQNYRAALTDDGEIPHLSNVVVTRSRARKEAEQKIIDLSFQTKFHDSGGRNLEATEAEDNRETSQENQVSAQRSEEKPAQRRAEETEPTSSDHEEEDSQKPRKEIMVQEELEGTVELKAIDELLPAELGILQRKDTSLRHLFDFVGKSENRGSRFVLKNDVLFRERKRTNVPEGWAISAEDQICVPHGYREKILKMAHEDLLAGHFKRKRTQEKVSKHFYWPNMERDIREFCDSCEACQKVCHPIDKKNAKMIEVPIITKPWSKLIVDLTGPMKTTARGNKLLLTVIDSATRYMEGIPLQSGDTEVVADALVEVFSRMGWPDTIQSDNGGAFVSNLMEQLWRLSGVRHIKGSVYQPQSQGLVERQHSVIKSCLRAILEEDPTKEWDSVLPYVMFAIRDVKNRSTGFSPAELMFGREFKGPLSMIRERWENGEEGTANTSRYVLDVLETISKVRETSVETQEEQSGVRKKYYDKKVKPIEFKPGDEVLTLKHNRNHKLQPYWAGPFKILSRVNDVNYIVGFSNNRHQLMHVNQMKRFKRRVGHLVNYVNVQLEESHLEKNLPILECPTDCENFDMIRTKIQESNLDASQQRQLLEVLGKFSSTFSSIPGRTNLVEYSLELTDLQPVRVRAYRGNPKVTEIIKKEIDSLVELGILIPTVSDYSSPLFVLDRPGKSPRPCVNYKQLNAKTKFDAYPFPNGEVMVEQLSQAKFISVFDLSKGYFQCPVSKETQRYLAISTAFGTYTFTVLPFGLKNAPAFFMRLVNKLFQGMDQFCCVYLDDIAVFSDSWEEHLKHLQQVLEKIKEAGLTIKPSKVQLAEGVVRYLGKEVGTGCIAPQDEKIRCVRNFPLPRTKRQLRGFLGLVGYYQKFVRNFAKIAAPLTSMLQNKLPDALTWSKEGLEAVQSLKDCLGKKPILKGPDFGKPFILQTDASTVAISAILSQIDDEGLEHPVCYASRKLLPRESRYSAVELELLAILFGVEKYSVYLWGQTFTIFSDHNPLTFLQQMSNHNARLNRWSICLSTYDFVIKHRAGKANANCDTLSRIEIDD